jgi:hypothetical protein
LQANDNNNPSRNKIHCNKNNPFTTKFHSTKSHFKQQPIATKSISTRPHCNNNNKNNNPFAANSLQQIHLDTTHDTLSDNDAAGAPGVQFNLNDQVFQIFAFLLLAKEPVTPLRSSQK